MYLCPFGLLSKTSMEIRCDRWVSRSKLEIVLLISSLDIDDKNMQYARRNIIHNNLKSRIRPLQTTTKSPLIPLDALGIERWVHSQRYSYHSSTKPASVLTLLFATHLFMHLCLSFWLLQPPSPGPPILPALVLKLKWSPLAVKWPLWLA